MQKGKRIEPPVETNDAGQPLIHKLLERLGVLDPEDASDGMGFDTPYSDTHQPVANGSFRPLPQSPPITPSIQGTSFPAYNQFPGVSYRAEQPIRFSQVSVGPSITRDMIPFGQAAQPTSGLMLSMPSPPSSFGALGGEDSANMINPYGPMQWPGYNPQEEFYDFPGGDEFS